MIDLMPNLIIGFLMFCVVVLSLILANYLVKEEIIPWIIRNEQRKDLIEEALNFYETRKEELEKLLKRGKK